MVDSQRGTRFCSYAAQNKLTIDWQFGMKRWLLSRERLAWARQAAAAAAKKLGCQAPSMLVHGMKNKTRLPKMESARGVRLEWCEEKQAFERGKGGIETNEE